MKISPKMEALNEAMNSLQNQINADYRSIRFIECSLARKKKDHDSLSAQWRAEARKENPEMALQFL